MLNTHLTDSGARCVVSLVFWQDLAAILYNDRLAILLLVLLIIADFRFGQGESALRYAHAKAANDTVGMELYRWRSSRALRRSINKLIDYLLFLCVGSLAGQYLLKEAGFNPLYGSYAVALLIFCIEGQSIIGHFLYLHQSSITPDSLMRFVQRIVIGIVKKKL